MTKVRMGVLYLMAHLLITLAVLGGYIYTAIIGQPDETLKMSVFAIIGYWFGAAGLDKIKPPTVQDYTPKNKQKGA